MQGFFHYACTPVQFHRLTIPAGTFYGFHGTKIFCSEGRFDPRSETTVVFELSEGRWVRRFYNDEFTQALNRHYTKIVKAKSKVREKKNAGEKYLYTPMSYVPKPHTYIND